MPDIPYPIYPPWSLTLVCGASGTGRTRFAESLAARYRARLIDTRDILAAVRAVTGPEQLPGLFYRDAEDFQAPGEPFRWPRVPLTQDPEEYAQARLRAADALAPALEAVLAGLPARIPAGSQPHLVLTGRLLTPALTDSGPSVIVVEPDEEQVRRNLRDNHPHAPETESQFELRARASMLITSELRRRGRFRDAPYGFYTVIVEARPWENAAQRADTRMCDNYDEATALGGFP